MHELALMRSLVEAVEERAEDERVLAVRLAVGRLTCVSPQALAFCFDVCAEGTRLAGTRLDVVEVPGRVRCRRCGEETAVDALHAPCPCGSVDIDIVAGQELKVLALEVV